MASSIQKEKDTLPNCGYTANGNFLFLDDNKENSTGLLHQDTQKIDEKLKFSEEV